MIISTLKPSKPAPIVADTKAEPQVPVEDTVEVNIPKKLIPNGTQYFDNDLDDEAKRKVIESFVESARLILAEDKVTINSVAKLFSTEHSRVKKQWECSNSLKDFVESRSDTTSLAKVKRSIAKLSPEERELLLAQMKV